MKKYSDSDTLSLNNNYSKLNVSNSNDTIFVNKHLIRHLSFTKNTKKYNKKG